MNSVYWIAGKPDPGLDPGLEPGLDARKRRTSEAQNIMGNYGLPKLWALDAASTVKKQL
jgi:hypothetical protein